MPFFSITAFAAERSDYDLTLIGVLPLPVQDAQTVVFDSDDGNLSIDDTLDNQGDLIAGTQIERIDYRIFSSGGVDFPVAVVFPAGSAIVLIIPLDLDNNAISTEPLPVPGDFTSPSAISPAPEIAFEAANGGGNVPPVAEDDLASTEQDTAVAINVLNNDSDSDGGTLSVSAFDDPANGTVVDSGGGVLTYTPDAGFTGTDTFTYTVADGQGGDNTATVTVTVSAPAVPTTVDLEVYRILDGALNGALQAPPFGGTLAVDSSQLATATIDSDDAFLSIGDTVTTAGQGGLLNDETITDILIRELTLDGETVVVAVIRVGTVGDDISENLLVPLDVDAGEVTSANLDGVFDFGQEQITLPDPRLVDTTANNAPVAVDDSASTDTNSAVTIDVLENDSDSDGDDLTISAVGDASNGTVVNNGGDLTYTPDADFTGTDTFTYTVSDGEGGETSASVTVIVADPPVATVADLSVYRITDGALNAAIQGPPFGGALTLSPSQLATATIESDDAFLSAGDTVTTSGQGGLLTDETITDVLVRELTLDGDTIIVAIIRVGTVGDDISENLLVPLDVNAGEVSPDLLEGSFDFGDEPTVVPELVLVDTVALSLAADSTEVAEDGTLEVTVTRNGSSVLPLTVSLVSSDTGEATVPATVTIPAEAASATFTVSGVDDSIFDLNQPVTISASAVGLAPASSDLTVTNVTPAPTLSVSDVIVTEGDTDRLRLH